MAMQSSMERMIQIGERGGIWVPFSITQKSKLELTRKDGRLVDDPPKPSFVPAPETPTDKRDARPLILREIEADVVIPGSVVRLVISLRDALRPPTPAEALKQLRRVAVGSGFMI